MKITRDDAIRIIEKITNQADPYWDAITDDWHDEDGDEWPTIFDVYDALGITREEYDKAVKKNR